MEGCPADDALVGYTILSGCLGLILFLLFELVRHQVVRRKKAIKTKSKQEAVAARPEFAQIQMEAQVVDGDVATQTLPGPSDVGLELGQICDSEDDEEDAEDDAALDVASFMHRAPLAVQADFPATRVYSMFTTLALRHLTVTDAGNRVLGIVTRKDVMAAVDRSH